jgi:transposase
MKQLTRLQTLEKQNKDLRIRLENRGGKAELALLSMEDELKAVHAQLREKDVTIAMLQAGYVPLETENEALRQQNESLQEEKDALREALDKAEDRASRLAAMLKKDSSTSDRNPASDFARAKATSTKEKSGKKIGGQPGHQAHRLMPSTAPDEVVHRMPPNACPDCGGEVVHSGSYEMRQVFDVEISVKVTEERAHDGRCGDCGKKLRGEFSEGYKSCRLWSCDKNHCRRAQYRLQRAHT